MQRWQRLAVKYAGRNFRFDFENGSDYTLDLSQETKFHFKTTDWFPPHTRF